MSAPPTATKRKSRGDKIDWDNLDPDEELTITLLRPSLEELIKNCEKFRRSQRRKKQGGET
jgi:hypothetical protein